MINNSVNGDMHIARLIQNFKNVNYFHTFIIYRKRLHENTQYTPRKAWWFVT